jgi:hypothetical protein
VLTVPYVVLGISAVFYGTVNDTQQPRTPVACRLNVKSDLLLYVTFEMSIESLNLKFGYSCFQLPFIKIYNYNFARCFVWVRNFVADTDRGT